METAPIIMKIEHRTLAEIDEEADVFAAPDRGLVY